MAVLDVIVGYVRGLKGDTGETGATGATGPGATVSVGTVTTTTYGNPAQVTNSGTATDAVLNFVIPQGAPGEEVTDVSSLTLDSVTSTAASFPIPAVGEVMSVIMGKIIKFFGDTVTALNAKLNRSDVTTSLGVTTTGQALDATAGKTLNDSISALNDSLSGLSTTVSQKNTVLRIDISITNGIGVQINSASNQVVNWDNFIGCFAINTNNVVPMVYTYSNLLYCRLKDVATLSDVAAGNYTVRVLYKT